MGVEVTDERVAAAAARLHDGGWWFTSRQLYYAVCADVETPPLRVAGAEIGFGLVLVLVGIITGHRTALIITGALGLLLVVVGAATYIQERRPLPPTRPLALSFVEFEGRFLSADARYQGLVGLVAPPSLAATPDAAIVICDRAQTAAFLVANRERVGDVEVLVHGDHQRDLTAIRVVVIHDCDPAGCAVAADLRDRGADVADAGINPPELAGRRLQLIEGAPARLPRDLSGHLDADAAKWLLSGRRFELATQSPEELVTRVRAALSQG